MASRCLLWRAAYSIHPRFGYRNGRATQFRHLASHNLPVIDACPSPICACAATPNLEIDHVKPLRNTVPGHSKHVVVHTCRDDWASRIEDDKQTPNIAKELKSLLGPKGEYFEVSQCTRSLKGMLIW